MSRSYKVIFLLALTLPVACGSPTRPEKDLAELQSMRQVFSRQNNADYDAMLDTMLRRMEFEVANADDPRDVTFDILVLHGGGAAGGFAAGFLKGWGEVQERAQKRPEFDYVTGASSGALLASTAIPGFFPPVEIDGHLYTDGGVAATMFLGVDALGVKTVAQQWRQRHPETPMPAIRIWVIINAKMYVDPQTIQPHYPDIAMHSINIIMSYDRLKALFMLAFLVDEMEEVDGVRAELRHVFIPEQATVPVDVTQLGDKDIIRNLVELGFSMGADPASWITGAPQVHRLPDALEHDPNLLR